LADFDGTEACQMVGHELAIEQHKSAELHPRYQPRQGDLRRIGRAAEHALAKECAAHRQPVKPANQLFAEPALDAVHMAHGVQHTKCVFDLGIDPCLAPVVALGGTSRDNPSEYGVCRDAKALLSDRLGERLRQSEFVQRQYRAAFGLDPESVGIVAGVGHRENAIGISAHQQVEVYGHAFSFLSCYHELRARVQSLI
jgi:hypothetical protein